MVDALSLPLGPSRGRRPFVVAFPVVSPASLATSAREPRFSDALLRPLLTSCTARWGASPFQARGRISLGKERWPSRRNHPIYCTVPWSSELRGHPPARPGPHSLRSAFCTSARRCASGFLQTVRCLAALASRLDRHDLLSRGLAPRSQRPCQAHELSVPPPRDFRWARRALERSTRGS